MWRSQVADARKYTGLYHDQIRDEFVRIVRESFPDLTEIDKHDPFWQLAGLVQFEGHRESSALDFAAAELSSVTAQRRPSFVSIGRRDGYALSADSPAVVDIVANLTGTPGPSDVLIPELAQFSTKSDADTEAIGYEYQGAALVPGSLAVLLAANAGATFAHGSGSLTLPGSFGAVNDAIYFGHAALQLSQVVLTYNNSPGVYGSCVEVYDNHFRRRRVSTGVGAVVDNVGSLTINVERLYSHAALTIPKVVGAVVRVTSATTGASEDLAVTWDGAKHVVTTGGYLGQSTPSTSGGDYILSAEWLYSDEDQFYPHDADEAAKTLAVIAGQTDGAQTGTAKKTRWQLATVDGVEAYWARVRIFSVTGSPTYPTSVSAAVGASNTWRAFFPATQGETVTDVLGTTTGQAFDSFRLNHEPFVEGSVSVLNINGVTDWEQVDTTSSSDADDRHFELLEDPEGFRSIVFGDGVNGAVPAAGQTVTATYRIGAARNGNVPSGKVTNAEAGTQYLSGFTNPRAATGWRQREGADEAGIERLRRAIPGSVRTRSRAVTADDDEYLAVKEFKTADGRRPFARALSIEQGVGYKSTLLVCVGAGGTVPTSDDIAELDAWFNGQQVGLQRIGARAMTNQRVVPVAYAPRSVDVTLTVEVVRRLAKQARPPIYAAVLAAIKPLAIASDGGWRWWAGAEVTDAAIKGIVGGSGVAGVIDVSATLSPAAPFALTATELPVLGTLSLTIVEV